MSVEGHKPLTNVEPHTRRQDTLLESAAPRLTNRVSLPYYSGPPRRRSARGGALETIAPDGAETGGAPVALRDVAVASFGDVTALEAVLGNDDRVRVADELLGRNPWRQICALRIRSRSNQLYVGTAWFISPRVLATAGHCVFLQDDGGWARSIDVIAAKAGASEPFGAATSETFRAVDGWVEQRSRDFDYGVIILDADLGARVGNFHVEAFSHTELTGVQAKISGYPADRDRAEFQYFHERPLTSLTDTRLIYDIDTFGGQSGSPIWQDTEEFGVVAIGIHTTGGISSNSGTRINDQVLDNLVRWIEE